MTALKLLRLELKTAEHDHKYHVDKAEREGISFHKKIYQRRAWEDAKYVEDLKKAINKLKK
jgi:hypothetical protein